jgi:hypothetical protein
MEHLTHQGSGPGCSAFGLSLAYRPHSGGAGAAVDGVKNTMLCYFFIFVSSALFEMTLYF